MGKLPQIPPDIKRGGLTMGKKRNKKNNEKSNENTGMTICSECGCSLKPENLTRHLSKVHGLNLDDEGIKNLTSRKDQEAPVQEIVSKKTTKRGLSNKFHSKLGGKKLSKKERRDLRKQVEVRKAEARKLELKRRRRRNAFVTIVAALALIGVVFSYNTYMLKDDESPGYEKTTQKTGDEEIRIPKVEITGEADFYSYDDDGVDIRSFGVRGSDGKEHMAFDACDSCFREKKGYRQVDDVMKCNNCQKEFPINSIGTENEEGGCWPSYLNKTIEGDDVVIKTDDLKEKRGMFE